MIAEKANYPAFNRGEKKGQENAWAQCGEAKRSKKAFMSVGSD